MYNAWSFRLDWPSKFSYWRCLSIARKAKSHTAWSAAFYVLWQNSSALKALCGRSFIVLLKSSKNLVGDDRRVCPFLQFVDCCKMSKSMSPWGSQLRRIFSSRPKRWNIFLFVNLGFITRKRGSSLRQALFSLLLGKRSIFCCSKS